MDFDDSPIGHQSDYAQILHSSHSVHPTTLSKRDKIAHHVPPTYTSAGGTITFQKNLKKCGKIPKNYVVLISVFVYVCLHVMWEMDKKTSKEI